MSREVIVRGKEDDLTAALNALGAKVIYRAHGEMITSCTIFDLDEFDALREALRRSAQPVGEALKAFGWLVRNFMRDSNGFCRACGVTPAVLTREVDYRVLKCVLRNSP